MQINYTLTYRCKGKSETDQQNTNRSIIHLHTGVKGGVKQTSKTQADREQRREHYETYSYIGDDYKGIRYRDGNRGNLVRQGTHPREKQEKRGSEGMRKIREKNMIRGRETERKKIEPG